MRNPLTFRVESGLGSTLVFISAVAFAFLIFIAVKNFGTDMDILSIGYSSLTPDSRKATFITPLEKELINQWLSDNGLTIPAGHGYKYVLDQHPDRPWLKSIE